MKEGGRGHDLDIYLGPRAGRAMATLQEGGCRDWGQRHYAGTGQEETILIESAGELEVVRDMRGKCREMKPMESCC